MAPTNRKQLVAIGVAFLLLAGIVVASLLLCREKNEVCTFILPKLMRLLIW